MANARTWFAVTTIASIFVALVTLWTFDREVVIKHADAEASATIERQPIVPLPAFNFTPPLLAPDWHLERAWGFTYGGDPRPQTRVPRLPYTVARLPQLRDTNFEAAAISDVIDGEKILSRVCPTSTYSRAACHAAGIDMGECCGSPQSLMVVLRRDLVQKTPDDSSELHEGEEDASTISGDAATLLKEKATFVAPMYLNAPACRNLAPHAEWPWFKGTDRWPGLYPECFKNQPMKPLTRTLTVPFYVRYRGGWFVSSMGSIYNRTTYTRPNVQCKMEERSGHPGLARSRATERLLVLSGKFSHSYWHVIAEQMARAMVVFHMLLEEPDLKVHVGESEESSAMLNFLGIGPERIVAGDYFVTGEVISVGCFTGGGACVSHDGMIAGLTHHFVAMLMTRPPPRTGLAIPEEPYMILIHRGARQPRSIAQHDELEAQLSQALERHLVFVFEEAPSLYDTFNLFQFAAGVLGPHGAGLVNAIASPPGTIVIELQNTGTDYVKCFTEMSLYLGHRYVGFAPSTTNGHNVPFDLSDAELRELVRLTVHHLEPENPLGNPIKRP